MAYLLDHDFSTAAIKEAYKEFLSHYRKYWTEETEVFKAPKDGANALVAIAEYAAKYWDDGFVAEHIEVNATAPLDPSDDPRILSMRIDAIVRGRDELHRILENKTASSDRKTWDAQWTLSTQVGAYIHALNCCYGAEQSDGAIINGMILRKKGNLPKRVKVQKTGPQMQQWLNTTVRTYKDIEQEHLALSKESVDNRVMDAFPINPTSCTDWGRVCEYHNFCTGFNNPLKHCGNLPSGIKVEHWNPHVIESRPARELLDIDTGEFTKTGEIKENGETDEQPAVGGLFSAF